MSKNDNVTREALKAFGTVLHSGLKSKLDAKASKTEIESLIEEYIGYSVVNGVPYVTIEED